MLPNKFSAVLSYRWTRFKPNKTTLPAAVIATALAAAALLAIWSSRYDPVREMDRYGTSMATALADTSAGELLHAEPITLAVIAQHLTTYEEISGIVFYGVGNRIVALNGVTDSPARYSAAATLDDTMTGSVSLFLNREAFRTPVHWAQWGLSLLAMLLIPPITALILTIGSRGNRSLPIISVPEPAPTTPQHAYLMIVNLHNQLALSRAAQQQALHDALTMANEVCALYQGIATPLPERGVALVLDASNIRSIQAVYASFLMQALLSSYETEGKFRCFLPTTISPDNPAEISTLSIDDLNEHTEFDVLLPIAALARSDTALISEDVYRDLDEAQSLAQPFIHPILEDLFEDQPLYLIEALPHQQAQLVSGQSEVILGFSQASA